MQTVSFTRMIDGTRADYDLLAREGRILVDGVPDRLLEVLESMRHLRVGYQISSLDHLLQTATRAEHDGADEEMIVAALLHDIGDLYAPQNHSEYAASILRPYVREEVHWTVLHHGEFQFFYYGRHVGVDPNLRERYRNNKNFTTCVHFCERWDQASFDPEYKTFSLEHFEPLLRRVFGRQPFESAGSFLSVANP